ncbi:MAG: ABC transporter permease [Candidatus Tectomicrobia bacterium]|jgi:peptide/nickel transport system permease protein|nr:ABC transporter permease [Candidatus Tectomicrobia bacterium]HEX2275896.1 ABC transporter permease [Candidatus Tectomicrobia bacterium]
MSDKALELTADMAAGLAPEKHGAARVWHGISLFVLKKPLGALGAFLLFSFIFVAIFAPWLATHDPDLNNYRARVKPPSAEHWFGTDNFGRDIYSRVVYGARISLYVGVLATLIGTSIGAFTGLISGFLGGRVDQVVQRIADVMFTIPGLVLAMAIVTMLGPSMLNVVIAISIPRIPDTNRVIRSAVLSAKESLYVDAAHAVGCANWRIMLQHILPNVTAPYIVIASAGLSGAILAEASLSFLGLGVPPPAPSWGRMLSTEGMRFFETAIWMAIFPGVFISAAVFGANLFGDALRDVLDPKLRGH